MLCQTVTKVLVIVVLGVGLMLLFSKLFYCLWIPIPSNARGCDLNAILGVIVVYWSSGNVETNSFVVSGSPSNPMLGEVSGMLCWGVGII